MNTAKKTVARILTLALALCLMVALVVPANATTANEKITDARNAVVQLQIWFVADEWAIEEHLSSGTGFFINEDTVVTCWHVIDYATESVAAVNLMEYIAAKYGVVYTPDQILAHTEIRVQILRDVYVEAEVRTASLEMDYAILHLKEKLYNRSTLPIRSSSDLKQTEAVYALGFPGDIRMWTDQDYYDADDVTITTGTVNKVGNFSWSYADGSQHLNVEAVETSAMITGGNSGGPLVDANGSVVGINAAGSDMDGSTRNVAIASNQLIATLDALGIPYTSADSQPQPTEAPTEATEAPTEAPKPTEAPQPTEAPTQPTEQKTDVVVEEKDNSMMIILIAAAAVVVVVVVVVVAIVSGKGKKTAPAAHAGGYVPPAPPRAPVGAPTGFTAVNPTPAASMDAGETTVLSQGAGETTLLSRNVNGGTLTRKRNGETIKINTESFVIGRERKSVNYCIADNSSISRNHVKLSVRGGITYLVDLGAANGTFVNGVKVMPRQEIALKNGDKITLADEDLEYKN